MQRQHLFLVLAPTIPTIPIIKAITPSPIKVKGAAYV